MSTPSAGPNPEFVKELFGSISKTYDRTNDVITFGIARNWRKKLVEWSEAQEGDCVLDCATGTGDLALAFKLKVGAKGYVTGSDFCKDMLELAPRKAAKLDLDVQWDVADATQLPYKDNSFDVTSIAYGIRNVNDPVKALQEMARVTRPGGRVMVLETGDTQTPVLKTGIQLYFKHLVPRLGGWISGKRSAYEYLNKSSSKFPCKRDFIALMESAYPFTKSEYLSLMGGASYIYKATK